MSAREPVVYIVEDNEPTRSALEALMQSIGVASKSFQSANEFLEHYDPRRRGCLVLDVFLPGMNGLELQEELNRRGAVTPVIFITGHGDVASAVTAVRRGAFNYLEKPLRNSELIANVRNALAFDRRNRKLLAEHEAIRARLASLTPREREVLELVARGLANKVMAAELRVTQRTVEIHRSRLMDKMGASSIAQLIRMFMESQREGPPAPAGRTQ